MQRATIRFIETSLMRVCTRMNETCVCGEEKERGFHFIDWTWLGPCMEGKLGAETGRGGGGSQKRQARSWCEIIPALRVLHTHTG